MFEHISCGNAARGDLCGGCWGTGIPTATRADLDDDYIAKMEDVLELYERPYDAQQPVICLDEKPITLHADLRPASRHYRAGKRDEITNMSVGERPMFSVQ